MDEIDNNLPSSLSKVRTLTRDLVSGPLDLMVLFGEGIVV
jgi:hypothetical protein